MYITRVRFHLTSFAQLVERSNVIQENMSSNPIKSPLLTNYLSDGDGQAYHCFVDILHIAVDLVYSVSLVFVDM